MEVVEIEALIVGAGVIGLAIGAELGRRGRQVFILEADTRFGGGISSRNSEVIHSGVYYPQDSLKRQLCVEGRRLLYNYCERHGVGHRKCGKLIVATDDAEMLKIEAIALQAARNGVEGVEWIDGKTAQAFEPALNAIGALHVRETGIIDSHAYMLSLLGEIEDSGGAVLFRHKVVSGQYRSSSFELRVETPSGTLLVKTGILVLAAGLWSHHLAARLEGYDARLPPLTFAKGCYFACSGPSVFKRLIYPAPVDGGLGTHLTLDLAGRMRFGPDVEWLDNHDPQSVDFSVDPARALAFYQSIRRYWPGLPDNALVPDYSGIRPKLSRPGEAAADFLLRGPQDHGIAGLVSLYGIESPGLTASPALALYTADLLS